MPVRVRPRVPKFLPRHRTSVNTQNAGVAQLVEQRTCNAKVEGSTPFSGTNFIIVMDFDRDAFAHGPIESKLWLCDELTKFINTPIDNVIVLGSWNGTMAFLLYVTGVIKFEKIFLVDTNHDYQEQARALCNTLDCQGRLVIVEQDANTYDHPAGKNLVINTSTDNIIGDEWFKRIPKYSWVILQGRTGGHRDCVQPYSSAQEFDRAYPMIFSQSVGTREFVYPDHSYTRYMKIGVK